MKVIYSISIVKNEADIIESFVRYNSSYLDSMVIINHDSSDNTSKILKNLQKEGYNIKYIKWDKLMHQQGKVLTKFIYKLIDEKAPDIIIPIDADEFLIADNEKNDPRQILEELNLNYVYSAKWKTYLPKKEGKVFDFVPENMHYIRNPELEEHSKLIIPTKLFTKLKLSLRDGSHNCNNLDSSLKKEITSLKFGHYPVRSKSQLLSNTLIGALNTLCIPNRYKLRSWHRLELLEKIINEEELDLLKIANEYSSKVAKDTIPNLNYSPMNLKHYKNIEIKYKELSKIDVDKNLIIYSKKLAEGFCDIKEENIALNKNNNKQKKIIEKQKKIIAELYPTKKWLKYKAKNIISRIKKIL